MDSVIIKEKLYEYWVVQVGSVKWDSGINSPRSQITGTTSSNLSSPYNIKPKKPTLIISFLCFYGTYFHVKQFQNAHLFSMSKIKCTLSEYYLDSGMLL